MSGHSSRISLKFEPLVKFSSGVVASEELLKVSATVAEAIRSSSTSVNCSALSVSAGITSTLRLVVGVCSIVTPSCAGEWRCVEICWRVVELAERSKQGPVHGVDVRDVVSDGDDSLDRSVEYDVDNVVVSL